MINLLIITHEAVGEAYRSLTHHFFPMGMPENIRILGVEPDEDQTDIINNAIAALQEFPENHGVLIMTDIFKGIFAITAEPEDLVCKQHAEAV